MADQMVITVKDLAQQFNLDPKVIRRHIRAHIILGGIRKATEDNSAKYTWTGKEAQEVIAYFEALTNKQQQPKEKKEKRDKKQPKKQESVAIEVTDPEVEAALKDIFGEEMVQ